MKKVLDPGLLLVENTDWMGIGIGVSIYREEDEYERFHCSGVVANIQSNGLVQIRTNDSADLETLQVARERILIKPGQLNAD